MNLSFPEFADLVHRELVRAGAGHHAALAIVKLHQPRLEVCHFKNMSPEDAAYSVKQQYKPELTPLLEKVSMVTEE